MSSIQRIAETATAFGFDQSLSPHPMRVKEALVLPKDNRREFYSREKTGVEVSGGVLKARKDTGGATTVFLPTRESNIHALFVFDGPDAAQTYRLADLLPRAYATAFNRDTSENLHALPELHAHVRESLSEAVPTVAGEINPDTFPSLAFAHVVPKNGTISHLVLGLGENMLAIKIQEREGHKTEATIITPDELQPTGIPGLRMDERLLPVGAQLILTTNLRAYEEKGGLDALTMFYQYSREILQAMQTLQTPHGEVPDLPSLAQLSRVQREHLLVSASQLAYDQPFGQFVGKGKDMAVAASLAAQDLATLAKDAIGNFIIPERIAFIGSRIPQSSTPRRRSAA